ncbi:MAG: type II toxin-antitoxin system RelE/ParE family toxin [Chlorobium sp.]
MCGGIFLLEKQESIIKSQLEKDLVAAEKALDALNQGVFFLQNFPFSCRKATEDNSFLRKLLVSFGASGYVALFEIDNEKSVTILAVRHQREEDYY